jgi:hypothetical protein
MLVGVSLTIADLRSLISAGAGPPHPFLLAFVAVVPLGGVLLFAVVPLVGEVLFAVALVVGPVCWCPLRGPCKW